MIRISPSIASCDLLKVGDEIKSVENKYDDLHIDIEDGNFTPNITFGIKMVKQIRSITNMPFSVHLMVTNPDAYLSELYTLGCKTIFIHAENTMYLKRYLYEIRRHNISAGLALNPASDAKNYNYLIDDFDALMYMTSEVDGDGEKFQKRVLDKMIQIKNKEIWIDGGINYDNITLLPNYANVVVMGRAIFNKRID